MEIGGGTEDRSSWPRAQQQRPVNPLLSVVRLPDAAAAFEGAGSSASSSGPLPQLDEEGGAEDLLLLSPEQQQQQRRWAASSRLTVVHPAMNAAGGSGGIALAEQLRSGSVPALGHEELHGATELGLEGHPQEVRGGGLLREMINNAWFLF